jgi:glycosyltransferase involved in cell wall biosynthesis
MARAGKVIEKFRMSSTVFSLQPLRGLRLIDTATSTWVVTDDDPQFKLKRRFGFGHLSGYFRLRVVGGKHINRLNSAALYFNSGHGFNEIDRLDLNFREESAGNFTCYIILGENVRQLRFDPIDAGRLTFSAQKISLERLDEIAWNEAEERRVCQQGFRDAIDGKLKIVVNLFRLLPAHQGAGGAGRLAYAFLRCLPEFANIRVIISASNESLIWEFPDVDFIMSTSESYSQLEDHFAWCDCYFDFLNGLRPTFIPRSVVVLSCLLDLQHMHFPMLFSEAELSARLREYGYAIDRADHLVAISEYERDNLEFFYGRTNVSVVPLSGFAAEDYIEEKGKAFASEKLRFQTYLVYPAVPWPHKNHETLIQAVAVLKRTGRHVKLVLTNTDSNPANKQRLQELCETFDLGGCVEFKGFLSESELVPLLRQSSGLVFPSLYEGFGIPLVDALKLGIPILASGVAAVNEICGTAAMYFAEPRNPLSMAEDIWRFWCQGDEKIKAVNTGLVRGELYSCRRMAEGVVTAARAAVASHNQTQGSVEALHLRPPNRSILSLLIIIESDDIEDSRRLLPALEDMELAFGANVEVTFGLSARAIDNTNVREYFQKCSRLIIFDAASDRSRQNTVEEFSRRHNNSEFHMVAWWAERDKICLDQVIALVQSLRHNPEAKYALADDLIDDVVAGIAFSELEIVDRFENLRSKENIIPNVMFRTNCSSRDSHHGTMKFLSAYCSETSFVRVPTVKAS